MPAQSVPNCVKCVNYFVTWEPTHPHGCKLYQFKSKKWPTHDFFGATGKHCQNFVEAPARKK